MDYAAHTPGRSSAASNDSASPRKRPTDPRPHDHDDEGLHKTPRGSLLSRLFSPGSSSRLCPPVDFPLLHLGEGVLGASSFSSEDEAREEPVKRSAGQGSPLAKAASMAYGSLQRSASLLGSRVSGSWPSSPKEGDEAEFAEFALPPRTLFGVDEDFHQSSKRFENKRLRRGL